MPLPDSFWESTPEAPEVPRSRSRYRGTVGLSLVHNQTKGHPEHYHQSPKRADLKRWVDEGCSVYVLLHYETDEEGHSKQGVRPVSIITQCYWLTPGILYLERRGVEHWHVIRDINKG